MIIGENKPVGEKNIEIMNSSTKNATDDVSISISHAIKKERLNSADDITPDQKCSTYSDTETRESNHCQEEKKVERSENSKSASESSVSIAGEFFLEYSNMVPAFHADKFSNTHTKTIDKFHMTDYSTIITL